MTEVFPKAPIIEALLDIRAELPAKVSLTDLEGLHVPIRDGYPEKKPRKRWEGTIELKDAKEPLTTTEFQVDGYIFKSIDEKKVVQFRLDGFTFNRLRPYSRWDDMRHEARRLWDIYRGGVRPLRVTRLALRYINSIPIPSKSFDYDDYFTATPKVPQGLPQLLQHFFSRIVIPFPDRGITAVVIQTPSDKQDPVNTAIIVDIDVFAQVSLAPED